MMKDDDVNRMVKKLMPFFYVMAKYEDLCTAYPWNNDYFRFDRTDISDARRYEKIIEYFEYMLSVLKYSRGRFLYRVDMEKWDAAKKEVV